VAGLCVVAARAQETKVRVLILAKGTNSEARSATLFLREVLEETGRFDVRLSEVPAGITLEALKDFDVVVENGGSAAEKAVAEFLEAGGGLVSVHHGSERGGPNEILNVSVVRGESPIVAGLKPAYRVADRFIPYEGSTNEGDVLATVDGKTVMSASMSNKGRVFCTALGNDLAAMHEKLFITTLARGTEWAATGKVTLGQDLGPPEPAANAVRALLITGGHEHESEFYSLFDGYKDLRWIENRPSDAAFKKDLRGRYDAIIMYDFTRDLDEVSKKNLRDYVENGGGVLVLHHALLSYEKWPWWFQEVSGGRYLLDNENGRPPSTYKGEREFFVTPAGDHPVTAAIGAFHLWDEAYKGMWTSSKNKPLLMTDNPDSDPCIAWVGPCQTARVVCIQLGHGHTAFEHPAYRALVHQAILWVARRETTTTSELIK